MPTRLRIKILPSEDLKSRRIFCRLNLAEVNNEEREHAGFAKVAFGGQYRTIDRTKTFELVFSLVS